MLSCSRREEHLNCSTGYAIVIILPKIHWLDSSQHPLASTCASLVVRRIIDRVPWHHKLGPDSLRLDGSMTG